MTFITIKEIDESVRRNGMVATLQIHGRKRVAPGFLVADYVKMANFYRHAHHPRRDDLDYWDKLAKRSRSRT